MSHILRFGSRVSYDAARASITLAVELRVGERHALATAKLDTGASHCVFRRELGEELGLVIESGERLRIETVTGAFEAYGHGVTLETGGVALDTAVYFAAEYGFPRNVVGRRGFVEQMRIGIVDYDGELFLSRYDDPS